MTLGTLLEIFCFAFAVAEFVQRIRLRGKEPLNARKELSIVGLSVLLLLSSVALYQTYSHHREVSRISKNITDTLGSHVKTFDQIFEALNHPGFSIVNETLDDLVDSGNIGHNVFDVKDDYGSTYRVRGYYVSAKSENALDGRPELPCRADNAGVLQTTPVYLLFKRIPSLDKLK